MPLVLLSILFLAGSAAQTTLGVKPEWARLYDEKGLNGSFLLYDLRAGTLSAHNPARVDSGFLPASTFKIFTSLVALETGVVRDENDTIRWDGVKRPMPGWNSDQTMRSAIRFSTVWFYQELARRIGQERMKQYVTSVHYGNEDISGGIDLFWLQGGLRVTPRQQVDFLRRLYADDLPFSSRTMATVKEILVLERTDDYVFRGKTGWDASGERQIGWFVGYLERGDDVYFFANCIDMLRDEDARARIGITREILQDLGLMERPD